MKTQSDGPVCLPTTAKPLPDARASAQEALNSIRTARLTLGVPENDGRSQRCPIPSYPHPSLRSWQQVVSQARLLLSGSSSTDRKSTRLNSSHLVISYAVF